MKLHHTGERMIPKFDKGNLIYNEHITRYKFASQFVKGKIVMDVACGEGYGSHMLIESGAQEVVGIDISSEAINHARKKYKTKKLKFITSNALSLPFKDNTFDIVVSFETIEHLSDQLKFVKEIKRLLKKNGLAILSTPNSLNSDHINKFHTKELTLKEFVTLIKNHFHYQSIFYQDEFFASSIYKEITTRFILNKSQSFNDTSVPGFFIILVSDSRLPEINPYIHLFNQKYPQKYYELLLKEKELTKIKKSRGWRVVKLIHKIKLKLPLLKYL